MEIWIIGIIIVGLMVYVSTRIKKESKRAYQAEVFETEHLQIEKPEGFLIPIAEDSPYVFEARSKEFGNDEATDFYQCLATIIVKDGIQAAGVFEETTEIKGVTFDRFRKVLPYPPKKVTFELVIDVLPEFKEKFQEKIAEMIDSLTLKK